MKTRQYYIILLCICYLIECLALSLVYAVVTLQEPADGCKRPVIECIPAEVVSVDIPLPYTITQAEAAGYTIFHEEVKPKNEKYQENDFIMVAMKVHAEAGNQSLQGRRYVAAVIYNRVESPLFPNTVIDVVTQSGQFAGGTKYTAQDLEAARLEATDRSDPDILYFRRDKYHKIGNPAFSYGVHYFSTQ